MLLTALSPSVSGPGRSRGVDCLTEPGIVCFPAALSSPAQAEGACTQRGNITRPAEGVSTLRLRPGPLTRSPIKHNLPARPVHASTVQAPSPGQILSHATPDQAPSNPPTYTYSAISPSRPSYAPTSSHNVRTPNPVPPGLKMDAFSSVQAGPAMSRWAQSTPSGTKFFRNMAA